MAFTLKKHTSNQLESARLNDVNDNWGDIEQAIDILQTNASLRIYDNSTTSLENAIKNKWADLPLTSGRFVDLCLIRVSSSNLGIAAIIKTTTSGRVLLVTASGVSSMSYDGTTWS